MIDFKSFGSRVKILRKEQNVTQERLAEHLNVSVEHISRIENGTCRPSLNLIENISSFFGIDEQFLLFGGVLSDPDMRLLEKISLLPDEKKKAISMIIDLIE